MKVMTREICKRVIIFVVVISLFLEASVSLGASAVSRLHISGAVVPVELKIGEYSYPKGIISSNYKLSEVYANIVKANGVIVYEILVYPNKKTYDIASMSNQLQFHTLPEGSYVFVLQATDVTGMEKVLLTEQFSVVSNVGEWVENCKAALQYYKNHKFSYGPAQPTYVATRTKNRKTNCAAYVSWCLQRNGFVKKESNTNQVAQGVATYMCQLGWKMNKSVDRIKEGDVVYYSQSKISASRRKKAIKWIQSHKPSQAGSGMHVDICYNSKKGMYLSAGSSKGIKTGKVTKHASSYMTKHFICSFQYPK